MECVNQMKKRPQTYENTADFREDLADLCTDLTATEVREERSYSVRAKERKEATDALRNMGIRIPRT